MKNDSRSSIAAALVDSHRDGVCRSAAAWDNVLESDDDAYAIQDAVATRLNWFPPGSAHIWKSGGASRIDELSHARLPPGLTFHPDVDLGHLGFRCPYVQGGIVLRLNRDVTSEAAMHLTNAEADTLIGSMAPAIEISDSRWQEQWEAPWLLRLAPNELSKVIN